MQIVFASRGNSVTKQDVSYILQKNCRFNIPDFRRFKVADYNSENNEKKDAINVIFITFDLK